MISVIVPVYNAGAFLEPLVRSVLDQTEPDLELLLIDDGSTDGSGALCDSFAQTDNRIRVFHKKNGGQSAARNLGLEAAGGDYIAFADHDDVLHPRLYETLLHAMEGEKVSVSACQFENTPQEKIADLDFTGPIAPPVSVSQRELVHRFFTPAWHIPIWNKLYRREAIRDLRFHGARLGEDNLFSYQIVKRCERIAFCPTTLYFQRMHGGNFEFTGIRYMVELISAKETVLEDIHASFPEEYRGAQAKFLYECVRIYNLYEKKSPEFDEQKQQVLSALRKHAKGVWAADLPLGHKLWFARCRLFGTKRITGELRI